MILFRILKTPDPHRQEVYRLLAIFHTYRLRRNQARTGWPMEGGRN